jgi:transcriptional regulator with XRE-family HTH domain/tetratricopeptide (TPR) repeat protein
MRVVRDEARDLGLAIVLLCELCGFTRRELSRRTGIDKGVINDYVKGRVKPTPKTLKRLAAAFVVDPLLFEQLTPLCRAARLAFESAVHQGEVEVLAPGEAPTGLEEKIASAARDAMAPFLQELFRLARDPAPGAEDRLWTEAQWRRVELLPPEEQSRGQDVLVDAVLGDERSWALAERICLASESAAADRADEALRLARLAMRIAEHVPGADWRLRLLGWVEPFVANALRVGGDLAASARTLAHADELWEQGATGAPAGLLDETRRLDLKASLLMHYGRFEEVHSLLAEALKCARTAHARARLLIKQSRSLEFAAKYEEALEVLRQAKPLIDAKREPRLLFAHNFNRTVNLLHLDRHGEAEPLLPLVEALTDPGNELDGVRLRWLQGRAWAGLGRRAEAVAALTEVHEYFLSRKIAYDFAVVSVELGTLYLEQGHTRIVQDLARRMMWIFKSQGIHTKALEALALFCHAAKEETVEAEWTRGLVKYLYRAQHNPGLRFEA